MVRLLPHSSSDDQRKYRTEEDLDEDKKRDPIKVLEDQFLDEFLPKVVCSNSNCEVVDKNGNIKGYITQKELS